MVPLTIGLPILVAGMQTAGVCRKRIATAHTPAA